MDIRRKKKERTTARVNETANYFGNGGNHLAFATVWRQQGSTRHHKKVPACGISVQNTAHVVRNAMMSEL